MYYVLFFVCQLINVVLGTIKSVVTIKGTRMTASIFSAINYGFNTFIIKVIAGVDLWIAILVSMSCNFIGVNFGMWITEKLRKEQLWKITVTVPTENLQDFKHELLDNDIDFIIYETTWDKYKVVDVFSRHRSKSHLIREIFKHYNVLYTISANVGTL